MGNMFNTTRQQINELLDKLEGSFESLRDASATETKDPELETFLDNVESLLQTAMKRTWFRDHLYGETLQHFSAFNRELAVVNEFIEKIYEIGNNQAYDIDTEMCSAQELQDAQDDLERADSRIEELEEQVSDLESYERQVVELEKELEDANSRIAELEEKLKTLEDSYV